MRYNVMSSIDPKTAKMISKALMDLDNMAKFQEEFCGVLHGMVLELYNQMGIKIPKEFTEYKFKNKNPWYCPDDS